METKEQYYKRIEPADAHVLEKFLKPEAEHSKISNGVGEVSEVVEEKGVERQEAKFVGYSNLVLLQVGQREN